MSDQEHETGIEKPSAGATRRDLFRVGNMLALPALVTAWEVEAAPAPAPLKTGSVERSLRSAKG